MSEGFIHSVKVPRLYKTVAKVVQNVQENGASLKQLIYEQKHTNVQGVYALAFNTVRHGDQLNQLIRKSQILFKEQRLDPWLTRVLITELIWGKQCLKSESKPIQTVLSYENLFREEMKNITEDVDFSKKVTKPRYVRVNTLAMSVNEAIENFQEEGWNFQSGFENYSSFLKAISNLNEETFVQDFHIPDLLVFPHGTAFFNHPGYKSGSIILQDKASCFPAFLLNPPIGSSVLDMCSAPGMKSTHLAAILQNRGKIFSIEMDERRFKTLCDFIELTNSRCVETINKDALTIDSTQCPNIEYILVDPSCSGSGMVDREKVNGKIEKCAPGRLRSLQSFQVLLLRHALLNFPTAKRVIYSTCSIQPEENEHVIDEILSDIGEAYKLVPPKELLSENWINFSSLDYKCQDNCLYARPETDFTNGFFVAVFERDFNVPLPEYKRRSKAKKDQENKIQNQENKFNDKQKEELPRESEDYQENDVEMSENKPENSETKEWVMTASQKKRMRRRKKQNKLKSENSQEKNLPGNDGELIPNLELKPNGIESKDQLVDLEANDKPTERKKKKKNKTKIENCPEEPISTEETTKNEKSTISTEIENSSQDQEENSQSKKKKKKRKLENPTEETISKENSLSKEKSNSSPEREENSLRKKKKKKRKLEENSTEEIISKENSKFEKPDESEEKSPTKKKKKSKLPKEHSPDNEVLSQGEVPEEKKKKHKTNEAVDIPVNNQENENPTKKKKKKEKK